MTVATDLPREARAFLDALAVGESGGDDDPYHVLYGGGHFDETTPSRPGYFGFPVWAGKDNSHAAGRYQFEPATWKDTAESFDGETPDFRLPVWQDRGAWALAQGDYHARTGRSLLPDLSDRPTAVSAALKATWTSLNDEFTARYAAALVATGPAPIAPLIGGMGPVPQVVPWPIPPARDLQHALNLAGATLKEDGIWGPLSQMALAEYYRRQAPS